MDKDLSVMLGRNRLSTWNTSGRPTSPKRGTFGFNTELNQFEVYTGVAWYKVTLTAI